MPLFDLFSPLVPVPHSDLHIETPFGPVRLRPLAAGEPLPVREAFVGEEGLELRRYGGSALQIELLLARVRPTLPQGMRVDGCIGVAWRAKSSADNSPISLRAEWEAAPPSPARELLSDGALVAATWDFLGGQASLGVAEEGVRAHRVGGGLEIVLVARTEDRTEESTVSIAWKMGSVKPSDASTWFAADAAHTAMTERLRKGA